MRYVGGESERGLFRALVCAAWFEWRTGLILMEGAAPDDFEVRPPGWFVRQELGFAFEHGPSLMWTCSQLAKTNERAIKQLRSEAPLRVTYPRDFVDPRRKSPRARRSAPIAAGAARGETLISEFERIVARWTKAAA